jgi:hypothetical protein
VPSPAYKIGLDRPAAPVGPRCWWCSSFNVSEGSFVLRWPRPWPVAPSGISAGWHFSHYMTILARLLCYANSAIC